ncbi:MAG TPA: hypothetical protein VGM39_18085 [Kofleriaceae bacterium]|jgi:hypothetical protein
MSEPVESIKPEGSSTEEKKPSLKVRLKRLIADYGNVAIFTYLGFSLIAVATFSIIIGLGFGAESSSGIFATIVAGWLAAKVTVPLRIIGTLALTPIIGTWLKRRKIARGEYDDEDDDEDAAA